MPIPFVLSGIVFIYLSFVKTMKSCSFIFFKLSLCFIMLSYFGGEINFENFGINLLGGFGIILFLFCNIKRCSLSKLSIICMLILFVFAIICFDYNHDLFIRFDWLLTMGIILLSMVLIDGEISRVVWLTFLSTSFSIINSVIMCSYYGYTILDFHYVYECVSVYVVMSVIIRALLKLIWRRNEKYYCFDEFDIVCNNPR